jgi:hypothetical protein
MVWRGDIDLRGSGHGDLTNLVRLSGSWKLQQVDGRLLFVFVSIGARAAPGDRAIHFLCFTDHTGAVHSNQNKTDPSQGAKLAAKSTATEA